MKKIVVLVRTDIGMHTSKHKGKMAAQVGHAVRGLRDRTTKSAMICVRVDDLTMLEDIVNKATYEKLDNVIITDSGKTLFKEPTITCGAIGPGDPEVIDKLTGHLKLI